VTCELDGTVEAGHCTYMAGLGKVCSHVAAILSYLKSASCASTTCTQIGCAWKEPRLVETIPDAQTMDIPFTKPKGSISASCNRKRGAHLYADSLPLSDLPQFSEAQPQESSIVELTSRVNELESDDVLSYNEDAGTLEQSVSPESSQPSENKSSGDFSFFSYCRLHLQMRTN